MRWCVHIHPGSALRFSQPLSGFLAYPSFVALFRATTVPRILPSELFPHKDRVSLSRSLVPLQLSTCVLKRAVRCLITTSFTDVHAFTRLPGSSCDYGLPFHEPRSASWLSWASLSGTASFHQLHLLRNFLPLARPFQRLWVAPPLLVVSLLGFCLFEAFSFHVSDSRPAQTLRPEHVPLSEDSRSRLKGPQPLKPGETFLSTSTHEDLVDGFQPP
jgi:hypothetical protein